MAHAAITAHRVLVEAPDGAAALELERTLVDFGPTALMRGGHWIVEIPAVRDLDELDVVLRHWLRDMGAVETKVQIDDARTTLRSGRARHHRSTHGDFIG